MGRPSRDEKPALTLENTNMKELTRPFLRCWQVPGCVLPARLSHHWPAVDLATDKQLHDACLSPKHALPTAHVETELADTQNRKTKAAFFTKIPQT